MDGNNTAPRTNNGRRKPPGCVMGCVGVFALVFVVVFSLIGWQFVSNIWNENSNSATITILVEDKNIVTSNTRRTSTTNFVVEATVVSENNKRELFTIKESAQEAQSLYVRFKVGNEYTVSVNGDADKYRVITGIVNE